MLLFYPICSISNTLFLVSFFILLLQFNFKAYKGNSPKVKLKQVFDKDMIKEE